MALHNFITHQADPTEIAIRLLRVKENDETGYASFRNERLLIKLKNSLM